MGGVYVDFHNVFDNSLEFLVEYPNDFLTEGKRMISHTWGKTGNEVYDKQTISHGEIYRRHCSSLCFNQLLYK